MDKYLKMSYAFKRKVSAVEVSFLTLDHHNRTCDEYAAHAINSHDELVAEVERLRDMVIRMQAYLDMAGEYPEKESDNPVRQWLFDAIDCTR